MTEAQTLHARRAMAVPGGSEEVMLDLGIRQSKKIAEMAQAIIGANPCHVQVPEESLGGYSGSGLPARARELALAAGPQQPL